MLWSTYRPARRPRLGDRVQRLAPADVDDVERRAGFGGQAVVGANGQLLAHERVHEVDVLEAVPPLARSFASMCLIESSSSA